MFVTECISIFCLQLLSISKPESVTKLTCTHWKSDFPTQLHLGTPYCEEPYLNTLKPDHLLPAGSRQEF